MFFFTTNLQSFSSSSQNNYAFVEHNSRKHHIWLVLEQQNFSKTSLRMLDTNKHQQTILNLNKRLIQIKSQKLIQICSMQCHWKQSLSSYSQPPLLFDGSFIDHQRVLYPVPVWYEAVIGICGLFSLWIVATRIEETQQDLALSHVIVPTRYKIKYTPMAFVV